jgi:hypothetical protein
MRIETASAHAAAVAVDTPGPVTGTVASEAVNPPTTQAREQDDVGLQRCAAAVPEVELAEISETT